MSERVSKERLSKFKDILIEWTEKSEETVNEIRALADDVQKHFDNILKLRAGGAATSIVGGILFTVGFGLSFVTFGASLGLSIAGGIIAGSGGIAVGGSMASDAIFNKDRKKDTNKILKKYNESMEAWKNECIAIGFSLEETFKKSNSHFSMADAFPKWYKFWFNLIIGAGYIGKNAGWNIIANIIMTSLRIVTVFDDAVFASVRVGTSLFKMLGPASKGLHIAGGVVGIVLIPLDIYTLVDAAIKIHKNKLHETASAIRKIAEKIEKECPTKNDIEEMIDETSNLLEKTFMK